MKEIILTMKEKNIYEIIKKLVDNNGNKHRVALRLGCSIRNVNLLIKKYKEKGKAGFSHGNKLRAPSIKLADEFKKKILILYETKYFDFNWKHFQEKLKEVEDISISYNALYKILYNEGYISGLAQRKTKKKKTKELEKKKKLTQIDKKVIQDDLLLDNRSSHPRKPRSKYFGELIQMDACGLIWFEDMFATLHLAVDDCTREVVGAYFTEQETLNGYYHVLYQILINYGIPNGFLTDNRTVFIYKQKNNPTAEEDTYTQFAYACKQLGISINTSSVPQRKGRIERFNGTFQRRLPQELRIANVKTIEEANEFLNSYIKKFNKRFSLHNNNNISVFENKPSLETINKTLAIICTRKFDSGSAIKFNNKYYLAYKGNDSNIQNFKKGVEALVINTFDNKLYASVNDSLYTLLILEDRKKVSEEFDIITPPKPKTIFTPPMSHPWKRQSYLKYLSTLKNNSQINAYV